MLYKTITKGDFQRLIELMLEQNEIIAPRKVGEKPDGTAIHQFLPIERFEDMDLDYSKTEYSAKTYFIPFRETLSTWTFENGEWKQNIAYRERPRAIIGLHACDIHALLKLDKVMLKGPFPSPYYKARRENTIIVGMDHEPCGSGFCASLGTDILTHGFDLFLTNIGERFFVAIDSDKGFRLLQQVPMAEVSDSDRRAYVKARSVIAEQQKTKVNTRNLPTLLDLTFNSTVWEKWGSKCLSCGACAAVCPTCYCYGVKERVCMDMTQSTKVKQLHSCNLVDFAEVAGGHNFRPTREHRLKYRYYHQHRGFTEAYDEPMCVGCNRCGDACLAGINPPDVIRDLEQENP